ncbi:MULTISPECIES: response regulator transcription factor [Chryseobacterium]|uniref:DNA-binding response regulator n=1 Tax=Chryseobacterium indologenes TaxID=253 RepID=A0AAD0YT44_CHRID|nr:MULTISPECIES: response regulator transcription factor [Chryseobacterium]ATN06546.1 DNA-binding response regulator [Chryseobacterium indologenes]AYY84693.1 DNA-binding response regulator [Chryseobacterium indologenes]AZB18424.1 DNA-binding response regulator [Chryseobacterium indologenes]QIX81577.1 response regulator transcription factor [Chryseobacterium indologenes]TLX23567.1 response regulator transcription factor [Chryseobacterium indologenes]
MTRKILIADDHHVVRIGTAMILEKNFDDIEVDFAETYDEAKQKVETEKFDLIILDIELPGSILKSMVKEIKMISEDILILIFTSYKENIAIQYIEEGANGFLNKQSNPKDFVQAVDTIFKEGCYYTPEIMKEMVKGMNRKKTIELLSDRELQVFNLLAKGNGNLEIANTLDIQESTVGTYKRRVYQKLKIANLVELLEIYKEIH